MVSESFNPLVVFDINIDSFASANFISTLDTEKRNDINTAIKYVLQHSIVYYPIELKISPSLKFDNEKHMIESNQ